MAKTLNDCWCGCCGKTANRFVPGHDSKFHSQAKQVARGTLDEETLPALPCDEAAAEFARHVALEAPKHAARLLEAQAKADRQAQAKADREQRKALLADAKEATKIANAALAAREAAKKAQAKAAQAAAKAQEKADRAALAGVQAATQDSPTQTTAA